MPPPTPNPPPLLRFIFQPSPSPLNCTTQGTTREFLANAAHPLHLKTTRRLAAFDAAKLHLSVSAPLDAAKKRVVRSWVARRVRVAVREELRARGWGVDGSVILRGKEGTTGPERTPLRGALRIFPAQEARQGIITASGEDVRQSVRGILSEVVRRQVPLGEETGRGGGARDAVRGRTTMRKSGRGENKTKQSMMKSANSR